MGTLQLPPAFGLNTPASIERIETGVERDPLASNPSLNTPASNKRIETKYDGSGNHSRSMSEYPCLY